MRKTFPTIDVDVTLKIKLSQRRPCDFLAWQHDKNDCFSVRSAYRMGLRLSQLGREAGASSSSEPLRNKPIWKATSQFGRKSGSVMFRLRFEFSRGRHCRRPWLRSGIRKGDISWYSGSVVFVDTVGNVLSMPWSSARTQRRYGRQCRKCGLYQLIKSGCRAKRRLAGTMAALSANCQWRCATACL